VLAKLIHKSDFIGSPLALEALLANSEETQNFSGNAWDRKGDEKLKSRPLGIRKLVVGHIRREDMFIKVD
jgi:hypothetical protein